MNAEMTSLAFDAVNRYPSRPLQRLRGHHQLGGEDVSSIPPSREGLKAVSDVNLVKELVPLVQVVRGSVVEVSTVVVAAPVVEQRHRAWDRG